jgi:hypothetical protein
MTQRLAIKKLTASDLTIFKWHVDHHFSGSKQKAINLNANVLVSQMYPNLPNLIDEKQGSISIDLHVYGPGIAGDLNLQRKVQKKGSYKNYRLNGEVIFDPEDNPNRFHNLQPDDIVILDFIGDLKPESVRAVFIARTLETDKALYGALNGFLGVNIMSLISSAELETLNASANLPLDHPANLLILEAPLEDAALGGIEGINTLRNGPYKGKVSRQTFEEAKKNAQQTGRLGEQLSFDYLEHLKNDGLILDVSWDADENAIAPYDLKVSESDGSITYIDAKSTKGSFGNTIHLSYNELLKIQDGERYQIYRLFDIGEKGGLLRIAGTGLTQFAASVISVFQSLPPGIQPDGISFSPTKLNFGEEIPVFFADN